MTDQREPKAMTDGDLDGAHGGVWLQELINNATAKPTDGRFISFVKFYDFYVFHLLISYPQIIYLLDLRLLRFVLQREMRKLGLKTF